MTTEKPTKEEFISKIKTKFGEQFTVEQYTEVYKRMRRRFADNEELVKNIQLEPGPGSSVKVFWNSEVSPIYADPEQEYSVYLGKKDLGVPPEGKAKNGKGEDVFGLR